MELTSTAEQIMQELIEKTLSERLKHFDERLMFLEVKTGLVNIKQCIDQAYQDIEASSLEQALQQVHDESQTASPERAPAASDYSDPSAPQGSMAIAPMWEEERAVGAISTQKLPVYKLQNSVWELSLLLGLGVLSSQDTLLIGICGFLSCLIEACFVVILYSNMVDSEFTTELARDMKEWRVLFGHDVKFVDSITGESLVAGICRMSKTIMDGQAQATIYESVHKYGIRPDGIKEGLWPLLPVGGWLSLIALLVWMAAIVKEIISIVGFGCAVWLVPRAKRRSTLTGSDGALILPAINFSRALTISLCVTLPRLLIAILLGITGVRFLAATSSISDLILNVVALEVVLTVHTMLHVLVLPQRVSAMTESLHPLPQKLVASWTQELRPVFATLMVIGGVIASYAMFLKPNIESMQLIANAMCAGDIDFAFFRDVSGVTFTAQNLYKKGFEEIAHSEKYGYRAVLQATKLEHVGSHGLAVRILDESLLQPLMQMNGMTMTERNEYFPICTDLDSEMLAYSFNNFDTATAALLQELLQDPSIQSCAAIQKHCNNFSLGDFTLWNLRTLCPATCGCTAFVGSPVANMPAFGCPQACQAFYRTSLSNISCEDSDLESPLLSTYIASLSTNANWPDSRYIRQQGCKAFANPVMTVAAQPDDFCADHDMLLKRGIQSARTVCPVTCRCTQHFQDGCPSRCSLPPQAASEQ